MEADEGRLTTLLSLAGPSAVADDAPRALMAWLGLLRQWNARVDLTAARTDDELFDLMLADAAVLARPGLVPEGARVVDVGTGAGAPGLALALMRPDLRVTLVEPLAKRVSFLRTVLGTVGRTDIELVRERVENVVARRPNAWDVALSRATLAPAAWVPLGVGLAPAAWALLAREEPPSVAGAALDEDVVYVWPLTKAGRRAVRYRRSAEGAAPADANA
jgi:16S rRNA (guanine527-N7)-methyltransferase